MTMPHESRSEPRPSITRLSKRQRTCLTLAGEGLTSRRIAERLGLSPRTVDEHLLSACRVLGVRTRIQAVARCVSSERAPTEPRTFSTDP